MMSAILKFKDGIPVFLVALFVVFLLISGQGCQDTVFRICEYKLCIFVLVWSVSSLIFHWSYDKTVLSVITLIILWTGFEVILGFMQVYGVIGYGLNKIFILTGTFNNPGPYGGFLASSVCVQVAWLVKEKDSRSTYLIVLRYFSIAVITASLILILSTKSRASILALVGSMLVLLAATDKGRSFIKRYRVLILFFGIAGCIFGYYAKKDSAIGRVMTNKISMHAIIGNGLRGAGIGHFPGAYANAQAEYFWDHISLKDGVLDIDDAIESERKYVGCPEYGLNDIMQIGVEAGPVSMILYVLIIVTSIVRLYRNNSPFAYGLLSVFIFGLFSYPANLWQFQLLMSVYIASASLNKSSEKGYAVIGMAILSSVFLCTNIKTIMTTVKMYREWQNDRYFFNTGEYGLYAGYCEGKSDVLDFVKDYMIEYAYSLNRTDDTEKSDSVLYAIQRANNNPRVMLMLGDNSMARMEYDKAEEYYFQAFLMLPDRLTPLHKLTQLYYTRQDTVAFGNMTGSIGNFHPKIESSATTNLRNEIEEMRLRMFNKQTVK